MNDYHAIAQKLASATNRTYIIAPAGFGKTHLIANAIKLTNGKQLILTHTYAGVNSIRAKLKITSVSSSRFHIETIASFALKVAAFYPATSGWSSRKQPGSDDWNTVYQCSRKVIEKQFFGAVLSASYKGIFVDEYQDCSKSQHALIMALASHLPCRILGDPLQGIFDFDDGIVDWRNDIYPHFEHAGSLDVPWRWNESQNRNLGKWLLDARESLINNRPLPFGSKPESVDVINVNLKEDQQAIQKVLYRKFRGDESVSVIFSGNGKGKNSAHSLAQRMGGYFTSIEEIEGKELKVFSEKISKHKSAKSKFRECIVLFKKIFTHVSDSLPAGSLRGEIIKITAKTKNKELAQAANNFLNDSCAQNIKAMATTLCGTDGVKIYRRDLYNRLLGMMNLAIQGNANTLIEAYEHYHKRFRHTGRPLKHNKIIATTLLLKGLEYDHAVIINTPDIDNKNLYVAITRGKKSLTVINA